MKRTVVATLLVLLAIAACATSQPAADTPVAVSGASYMGGRDAITLTPPGCNAVNFAQVPGSSDLFIGRQLLTADGQLAGVSGPDDCSGGNPDNAKNGKIFNRWGLTLDRLDWSTHRFSIVKPVLDTSIDPQTGRPRSLITGGPMSGAIIQSAYDANLLNYRGQYWLVFECIVANGERYGVVGTSSCIGAYDPSQQALDLSRTQVIISGIYTQPHVFHAAAVPALLVFEDRLFLYWSELAIENGQAMRIAARGAELETDKGRIAVKGSNGRLVHAIDEPATMEVWSPVAGDTTADTTVDIGAGAVWTHGHSILAQSSLGGEGCTAPSGSSRGCYRLALVRTNQPLGNQVFNQAQKVAANQLPTNPQEYTRPIRGPSGDYWFIGHYLRPVVNGWSELRPAPGEDSWKTAAPGASKLIMYPLADKSLWPTD